MRGPEDGGRRFTRVGLFVLVMALVAGMTIPSGAVRPAAGLSAAFAAASLDPSTDAAPTAAPDTVEGQEAWGPVTLPADPPVSLTVPGTWPDGIPVIPTWQLERAASGTIVGSMADIAASLVMDPPVTLRVIEATDSFVRVQPATPLEHGTAYRITARDIDGARLASWRFRTTPRLDIDWTVPEDGSRLVPVRTGLEVTFNVSGVVNPSASWSIEPPVAGRTRWSDPTFTFVPLEPLAPETDYQVTLRAGVRVATTGEVLDRDVVVRFRTGPAGMPDSDDEAWGWGSFPRVVVETSPREPATFAYDVRKGGIHNIWVRVDQFSDAAAAAEAVTDIWDARREDVPRAIDPADLDWVLGATVRLQVPDRDFWQERTFTLPTALPTGYYLISTQDGPKTTEQAVLQVTDLAVYAHLSWTRSAVWVNDLKTGEPVVGASVRLLGGDALGVTGRHGLLVASTPESVLDATTRPVLMVTEGERSVLVPFGTSGWEAGDIGENSDGFLESEQWWSIMETDRSVYRTTDTINAWGVIKHRDTKAVPSTARLELRGWTDEGDPVEAWSSPIAPTATGTWAVRVPLSDVPEGDYELTLFEGTTPVRRTWLGVATLRKPAYQLDIVPAHRIFLAGEEIPVTVTATFFDGTPAAGIPIVVSAGERHGRAVTDLHGRAQAVVRAPAPRSGDWEFVDVGVKPARAEEGEIFTETDIVVFGSGVALEADATTRDGTGRLVVKAIAIDRAAMEREYERAWVYDFEVLGDPAPDLRVATQIIEHRWDAVRAGTGYDALNKLSYPRFRYIEHRRTIPAADLVTDASGRVVLTFPALKGREYELAVSAKDSAGRTMRRLTWAYTRGVPRLSNDLGTELDVRLPAGAAWDALPLGKKAVITMTLDGRVLPTGGKGRYLWLTSQRGLRTTTLTESPRFTVTADASLYPNVAVTGVRFTGSAYLAPRYEVMVKLDPSPRALRVTVRAGRPRYEPGDRASVKVTVRDARGAPVEADVVIRAIDEKLFAMGAASESDPLETLYERVEPGTLWTYLTHRPPHRRHDDGGKGDAGGSGVRSEFKDQVLFQLVHTDDTGHAEVSFDLSDDLTSWHIMATAVTAKLQTGTTAMLLPVGLPFFVDIVVPPEVLETDRPAVRIRSAGTALHRGDHVTFTVVAPSLGMASTSVTAPALTESIVPLPSLTPGTHEITVSATVTGSNPELTDVLATTLKVVSSRVTEVETAYAALDGPATPGHGSGWTGYLVVDRGRGASVPLLLDLVGWGAVRSDTIIASAEARRRLVEDLGVEPSTLGDRQLDPSVVQGPSGGIGIVPYASADLELSALVALVAPDAVDRERLRSYFDERYWDVTDGEYEDDGEYEEETDSADPDLAAVLAGAAALGMDVGDHIRMAAAQPWWSIDERLWLGLAAAAVGDETTAREIERAVLERHGQQHERLVRVTGPAGLYDSILTARMGLLAAWLGDIAIADGCELAIELDPPAGTLDVLERLGIAAQRADHLPAATPRFAVTLGGRRTEVTLDPGQTWFRALLPAQAEGLRFEPLEGSLALATTARRPLDPASIPPVAGISVTRTVTPAGALEPSRLVTIRIRIDDPDGQLGGGAMVTEVLPSGLVPVQSWRGWRARKGEILPWWIEGQRVVFGLGEEDLPATLRLTARVVGAGSYTWEPEVVESWDEPVIRVLGHASTIELR